MSCSVCAGYSDYNCPCCSEEPVMIPCPDCSDGYAYYASVVGSTRQVRVTKSAYMVLPFDEDDAKAMRNRYYQGDIEECPTCKGEQEIEKNRSQEYNILHVK